MALGERRRRILTAVVHDYVETAEPIGSNALAQRYDFGVRPATIRNELAAMSEMGYLRQPHTSAGRVPSDLGYRYYVDELMPTPSLEPADTHRARHGYDPYEGEVEDILQQTCRILSGLTKYTSLATPPQMDTISVTHVAVSAADVGRLLVVTVLNTGHIDHRVLDCQVSLGSADLATIGNLVNERLRGADLSSLPGRAAEELPADLSGLGELYKKVASTVKQALFAASDDNIYMDGTAHMLKQPEFARGDKMDLALSILERRRALFQTLTSCLLGRDVTVIIGSENRFGEMRDCSFIASRYSIGGGAWGSIGVVGPTRMDYRRAVAAVRFMASNLGELLTSLSMG